MPPWRRCSRLPGVLVSLAEGPPGRADLARHRAITLQAGSHTSGPGTRSGPLLAIAQVRPHVTDFADPLHPHRGRQHDDQADQAHRPRLLQPANYRLVACSPAPPGRQCEHPFSGGPFTRNREEPVYLSLSAILAVVSARIRWSESIRSWHTWSLTDTRPNLDDKQDP